MVTGKLRCAALGCGTIAIVLALTTAPAHAQFFVTQWGGLGKRPGQFNVANGVATDSVGNVYVADELNFRVQKFTATGRFITQWAVGPQDEPVMSPPGRENDRSIRPVSVALQPPPPPPPPPDVPDWAIKRLPNGPPFGPFGIDTDSAGNVYVTIGSKIKKFTSSGELITEWTREGDPFWSEVATDSTGDVYVTVPTANRIDKFTSSGELITAWDGLGGPMGVATDAAGNVYAVDGAGVVKFTSSGEFITQWGSFGRGNAEFVYPKGIDTDSAGNVYVGDVGNVQKFTSSGEFVTRWGRRGASAGEFCVTNDVATDSAGNVYVSDANERIQKFSPSEVGQARGGTGGPVLGVSLGLCNVSGVIKVKCPGDKRFRTVEHGEVIPVGCLVDTRNGSVKLTSAQAGGRTQSGVFRDGMFRVDQRKGRNSQVTLTLADSRNGGSFASCSGTSSSVSEAGADTAGRRVIRRLRSRARGRFRTRGRYSAATVRGTVWTTTDRCDGTLTKVRRGTVVVRDFGRKRTIVLTQGKSYLARAPG